MHTSNYIYGMCSWWSTCFNTYMHLKLRRHGMSIHWMSIVEILHDEDIRNNYIYSTIQSLGYKRQYLWRIKLHHQWNEALLPCIEPSQKSTCLEVQWVMNRQSYKILCQDTANTEGRVWILINRNAYTNMKLFSTILVSTNHFKELLMIEVHSLESRGGCFLVDKDSSSSVCP